ncbi:MAG: PEP-CTERM sorting domain-containing protein [Planctomycetes bacterium]|nr:PEP-CTERM sorting domain-containing protein [Planctomycetota bacterium]
MNKIVKALGSMALVLGLVTLAGRIATAGPIKLYSDFQKADVFLDQAGESYKFTFDLNKDPLALGNVNPEDDILSGYLTLGFKDDFDPWQAEIAILDYQMGKIQIEVDTGIYIANVTGQLVSDHLLEVTVTQKKGDFWLVFGQVSGAYRDNPIGGGGGANTPEPPTLILLSLGIGSLACALKRRRAAAKKSS